MRDVAAAIHVIVDTLADVADFGVVDTPDVADFDAVDFDDVDSDAVDTLDFAGILDAVDTLEFEGTLEAEVDYSPGFVENLAVLSVEHTRVETPLVGY